MRGERLFLYDQLRRNPGVNVPLLSEKIVDIFTKENADLKPTDLLELAIAIFIKRGGDPNEIYKIVKEKLKAQLPKKTRKNSK